MKHTEKHMNPEEYITTMWIDRRHYERPVLGPNGTVFYKAYWPRHQDCFTWNPHKRKYMRADGKTVEEFTNGVSPGQCQHCGNNIWMDGVILLHNSGEYIIVGWICAQGRFNLSSLEFQKKMAEKYRKAAKTREATSVYLINNPGIFVALWLGAQGENDFLADLYWRRKKGVVLTEKQEAAALKTALRILERKVEQKKEREALSPVVEGKGIEIAGKVLSIKWKDNDYAGYGGTLKMLILDDRNFKVWGTVPEALWDCVDKGSRIRLVANVTTSREDKTFGFYNRPRKAEVVK